MTTPVEQRPRREIDWGYKPIRDLGDVSRGEPVLTGPFGAALPSSEFTSSGVPVLNIGNVKQGTLDLTRLDHVSLEKAEELSRYRVKSGDLLFTRTGTVGRCAIVPPEAEGWLISYHLLRVGFNLQLILPQFAMYAIQGSPAVVAQVRQAAGRGATRDGVNTSILSALVLPAPPLIEQQRIVAALSEQLAAVERARVAAAVQVEAARALPAAYLRAVFESDEARAWPVRRLGDMLRLRKDVVHPHDNPSGPSEFVGLEHIESGTGKRIGSVGVEMSELTGRKPRFYTGDIVYGYLRPYLNKVWLAEFDGLCSVDQYVYEVQASARAPFVAWYMRSPTYLAAAPIDTTPGQLPRIRTEEVAAVEIPLPSFDVQERVVQRIEGSMAGSANAHGSLSESLRAIVMLPAALLREAFGGRMGPLSPGPFPPARGERGGVGVGLAAVRNAGG